MPEIVEVFLTCQFLNNRLKNKYLTSIKALGGRYSKTQIEDYEILKKKLPLKITRIHSKGKFMWFELEGDYFIQNTFGMSGAWGFHKKKHSDIRFKVRNEENLYFTDPRHFGTIQIALSRKELNDKLEKLGPDFIQEPFTKVDFYNRIKERINQGKHYYNIVEVLMDQTNRKGIGSGLGNYLVTEILYDARINPHTTLEQLGFNRYKCYKLADSIKYILKLALFTENIGYLADLDNDFYKFIVKYRKENLNKIYPEVRLNKDVFTFKIYGQSHDPKGNKTITEHIIPTRNTYWVPDLQL